MIRCNIHENGEKQTKQKISTENKVVNPNKYSIEICIAI